MDNTFPAKKHSTHKLIHTSLIFIMLTHAIMDCCLLLHVCWRTCGRVHVDHMMCEILNTHKEICSCICSSWKCQLSLNTTHPQLRESCSVIQGSIIAKKFNNNSKSAQHQYCACSKQCTNLYTYMQYVVSLIGAWIYVLTYCRMTSYIKGAAWAVNMIFFFILARA